MFDYVIDLFKHGTDYCFGSSPLLNRDYQSLFRIRSTWGKILLKKNIALSFEDAQGGTDAIRELLRWEGEGHKTSHVLASD